jgi:hypothetical protein
MESGGVIPVMTATSGDCDLSRLIDADVVVHGVWGITPAGAGNRLTDVMFVPSCVNFDVRRSAVADWSVPLVEIGRLLTYRSGTQINDRVRVRGIVTHVRSGSQFFIQQGTSGLLIEPIVPELGLKGGEGVEVLGRIVQGENGVRRLVGARLRLTNAEGQIHVKELKFEDLEDATFAGTLVSAESRVISREIGIGRVLFGLDIGGDDFTAELAMGKGETADDLPEVGDRASFLGIGHVRDSEEDRRYLIRIETRSRRDISILERRPLLERIPWGRVAIAAMGLALVSLSGCRRWQTESRLGRANWKKQIGMPNKRVSGRNGPAVQRASFLPT